LGISSTPGIPEEVSSTVVVGEFNSIESARQIFAEFSGRIAAVIVEPVLGNVGVVPPDPGFLEEIRKLSENDGALLIFDEVITGFRFHYGGFQSMCGIDPDITTLGKIIGGGLPIGLFGGRKDIMALISPEGPVYQGGTFSGNPLTMRAGLETLKALKGKNYGQIEKYLQKLRNTVEDISERGKIGLQFNHMKTMFTVFFSMEPVRSFPDAMKSNASLFMEFFGSCLKNGVYLPPSQFETNFISFSHSARDLEITQQCFENALNDLRRHHQS
jgi:glutamate-1-semialdehyde 2,1-aminomutase